MSTTAADVNLVLFLKAPHNAKRRLATEIDELATTAATLLWACALQDLADWRGPAWFSPADAGDHDWLRSELGGAVDVIRQRGANLGGRINHVDRALRAKGLAKLLFIGTDCPGLDPDYLELAAAGLQAHDAVLGPSSDGGVVLMGARRAWPDLTALPWSTDRLHDALSSVCAHHGWSVARLPVRSDIDTVADLLAARDALENDERPSRRELAAWIAARSDRLTRHGARGPAVAE